MSAPMSVSNVRAQPVPLSPQIRHSTSTPPPRPMHMSNCTSTKYYPPQSRPAPPRYRDRHISTCPHVDVEHLTRLGSPVAPSPRRLEKERTIPVISVTAPSVCPGETRRA
ncbi:hypothetical protein C2E23DRAFT_829174, partial [Lenzites betulinus]